MIETFKIKQISNTEKQKYLELYNEEKSYLFISKYLHWKLSKTKYGYFKNDELIGIAMLSNKKYIYCFYIKKNQRLKGYGKDFIQKIVKLEDHLSLHVKRNNKSAYHIYEQAGFKKKSNCLIFGDYMEL